jgi:peptidoglycan hydrolase-like protein with peptidoglycan-binding domain
MRLKAISLPCEPSGAVLGTAYLAEELVRRLKAYAAFYKVSLTGSGFRSVYDQASAYIRYKNSGGNPAAYPGESWHNCGLAYDVSKLLSGKYPGTMPEDYLHKPWEQAMNVFGLCIPMWSGSGEKEPWHVIPVECLGVDGSDRQWFLDQGDRLVSDSGFRVLQYIKLDTNPLFTRSVLMRGNDVRYMQTLLKIEADGVFGPLTEKAVEDFQKAKGLTVDGICGPETWKALDVPDYKALYEQALAEKAEMRSSIIARIQAIDDTIEAIRGDLS